MASRRRERFGIGLVAATDPTGAVVAGKAIATVAGPVATLSRGRSSTAVGGVVRTGFGSGGLITTVCATTGHSARPFAIAAANASTNAVALSQRWAGFLARPR